MIWLLMALMCLYGFFGNETWLPDWSPLVGYAAWFAAAAIGFHTIQDLPTTACWFFSCLLAYIGATRPGHMP